MTEEKVSPKIAKAPKQGRMRGVVSAVVSCRQVVYQIKIRHYTRFYNVSMSRLLRTVSRSSGMIVLTQGQRQGRPAGNSGGLPSFYRPCPLSRSLFLILNTNLSSAPDALS